ncbi:MAG: hypothetical protein P8X95_14785 [Anaerolineales bacterium]
MLGPEEDLSVGIKSKNPPFGRSWATKTVPGNKNRCWQQKPMLATKTVAKGKKGKK